MKIASVADVKTKFTRYLKSSEGGPIVITRNGRPVAVLLGVEDEEEIDAPADGLLATASCDPGSVPGADHGRREGRPQAVLGRDGTARDEPQLTTRDEAQEDLTGQRHRDSRIAWQRAKEEEPAQAAKVIGIPIEGESLKNAGDPVTIPPGIDITS